MVNNWIRGILIRKCFYGREDKVDGFKSDEMRVPSVDTHDKESKIHMLQQQR